MTYTTLFRRIIRTGIALLVLVPSILLSQDRPDNIILFIGDGLGTAHLSALTFLTDDAALQEFPVAAFVATQSASHFVTESAAGGTALSTGYRTDSDFVAMLPDRTPLRTLLEFAKLHGKAVGVVATSSVTHATPAAFLAHVPSRRMQYDIAVQIAESGAEVVIGGGTKWFLPKAAGGGRDDGRNLLAEMEQSAYTVARGRDYKHEGAEKLIWLLAEDAMPAAGKRKPPMSRMVEVALDVLSRNPNGYVLMVEGSRIDWAAHDNDFRTLKAELLDFHSGIRAALDYTRGDDATAIVVTSDHETGGLALQGRKPDGSDMYAEWTTKAHSGAHVPLLAKGPGSERFGGIHRNDEIGRLLFSLIADIEF